MERERARYNKEQAKLLLEQHRREDEERRRQLEAEMEAKRLK